MVKLSDAVEILDSKRIPVSSAERATRRKLFPYYGAQGVVDYIDDYIFDGDYVLVAEDGNNLKTLTEPIVTWATGRFWVNNHAHILGSNGKANIRYVFYYLMASDLRGLITGSAQPKLNQANLAAFEINLPSKKVQDEVVSILGAIDDKIANNKRIIKEFEETARLIYDYWFTQFDFPDENGKPYRSSGGKMVWNDDLKRDVPEGWEAGSLSSYISISKKIVTPKSGSTYEHYSIPAFDDGKFPSFEDGIIIASSKYAIKNGVFLYSKLNPKFKRLWFPKIKTDNAICSTEFLVMKPRNNELQAYCLSVLDSDEYYAYMVSKAISSTGSRSRVDPKIALEYGIALAPKKLLVDYSITVEPLYTAIQEVESENNQLGRLRDWLLPMLMNGQIKVN